MAEAARQDTGEAFQAAVDTELGAFWQAAFQQAHSAEGGEAGWWVLRAGRSAVPYLTRLGDWAAASHLLDEVLYRDQSPATVQMVLPLLRQVAAATTGTDRELVDAGRLARALGFVLPEAAETQLRDLLDRAVRQERFDLAVAASGELAYLLRSAGRLEEALVVVEQLPEFTRRAGLGPWTQLLNQGHRLTLLAQMGRAEEVLARVQELRGELAVLPDSGDQEERTEPWNVRELILHAGYAAALWLGRWEEALALNAEVVEITVARGATDLEIARTRFNGYGPLLRLGRLDEAERLLLACRAVFEDEGDLASLGKVLGAFADLEDKRGHPDDAIGFARAALRYAYATGDPDVVAASHHNLATPLERTGKDPAAALAHRLAGALISHQTGSGGLVGRLRALHQDLVRVGEAASLPASFAELCAVVGQVEGVRLAELVARLPRRAAEGDQALAEVLRLARALPDHASGGAQELPEQ